MRKNWRIFVATALLLSMCALCMACDNDDSTVDTNDSAAESVSDTDTQGTTESTIGDGDTAETTDNSDASEETTSSSISNGGANNESGWGAIIRPQ